MTIEIRITADTADLARDEMRTLLGRENTIITRQWLSKEEERDAPFDTVMYTRHVKNDAGQGPTSGDIGADLATGTLTASEVNAAAEAAEAAYAAKRERGKPSPGHTRRTKAEIAEDEAAGNAVNPTVAFYKELPADSTPQQVAEAFANISTGDERVGPEDDAETVEQDEADETAETAAAVAERPADKKLTLDDVRNALGGYVKVYGMAAAQADGPKVIALALKNGKAVKISDIPDDQAAIAAVIAGVEEMTSKNPFGHALAKAS